MRSLLITAGLLAFAAGAGPAAAADIAVRPQIQPPPAAPPPYVPEWTGFYIGVHGGGGWDRTQFDVPGFAFSPFSTFPNTTASGGIVGGHAGYNWQYGPVVGGVEVDFSAADISDTTPFFILGAPFSRDFKLDELASARGRIGWAVLPNLLWYGTAGLGFGHSRLTVTEPFFGFSNSTWLNEFGWVAGTGLEYRLFEHVLLRAEWLHYDFGRVTAADAFLPLIPDVGANQRDRVDVVRGGISYKF